MCKIIICIMISENIKCYEFRETTSHSVMYHAKCLHAVQWSIIGVNPSLVLIHILELNKN